MYVCIYIIKVVSALLLFYGLRQELYYIGTVWVLIFLPSARQREFPLKTIYHILSGGYDMAAGCEQIWSTAIVLWWRIYCTSREFRGNRKRAWWETDSVPSQWTDALKTNKKKGSTYISRGELQSTVSLTWWLPMAKTRVCHRLSASRVPRKPQCSTTPPWPRKRKCRRFLENLSPRMIRPRSPLLFCRLSLVLSKMFPLLFSSFLSPASLFSTFFGSNKEKMYSFLWKANRKNTQTHHVWQEWNGNGWYLVILPPLTFSTGCFWQMWMLYLGYTVSEL